MPVFQSYLHQLQDPDPAQRRQAVHALGSIRHPQARKALRYLYFNDPDQSVRQLALQYLPGLRARVQGMPQPALAQQEAVWDCVYCGTRDIKGSACPNCAAPRPKEADEKGGATASANDSLADMFRLPPNPGQARPMPPPHWQRRQVRRARRAYANAVAILFLLMVLLVFALMWVARTPALRFR